jgi:hypothetical protein
MANLIITIIAIALIASIATIGAYYGGSVIGQSRERAYASTILHQVIAIQSGVSMYLDSNPGTDVDDIAMTDLVNEGYIVSAPSVQGAIWTLDGLGNASLQEAGDLSIEDDNDDSNICDELLNASASWTCSNAQGILYHLSTF